MKYIFNRALILTFILGSGFSSYAQHLDNPNTSNCPANLLNAILDKDIDTVNSLLEHIDPNIPLENCRSFNLCNTLESPSLLHISASMVTSWTDYQSLQIYGLLVGAGANQDVSNMNGQTPQDILIDRMGITHRFKNLEN